MDITSHSWRSLSPGQSICFDDVPHSLLAGDAAHILPENKFTMRFRITLVSQVNKSDKNLHTVFVTCQNNIFHLKVFFLRLYTLTCLDSFEFKYLLQCTYIPYFLGVTSFLQRYWETILGKSFLLKVVELQCSSVYIYM